MNVHLHEQKDTLKFISEVFLSSFNTTHRQNNYVPI